MDLEGDRLVNLWSLLSSPNTEEIESASSALSELYQSVTIIIPILSVASNPPSELIRNHAIVGFRVLLPKLLSDSESTIVHFIESKAPQIISETSTPHYKQIFCETIAEYAVRKRRTSFIHTLSSIADSLVQSPQDISTGLTLWTYLLLDETILNSPVMLSHLFPLAIRHSLDQSTSVRISSLNLLQKISENLPEGFHSDSQKSEFISILSQYFDLLQKNNISPSESVYFARLVESAIEFYPNLMDIFPGEFFSLLLTQVVANTSIDDDVRLVINSIFPTVVSEASYYILDDLQTFIDTSIQFSHEMLEKYEEEDVYRTSEDFFSSLSINMEEASEDAFEYISEISNGLIMTESLTAIQVAFMVIEAIADGMSVQVASIIPTLIPYICNAILHTDNTVSQSACSLLQRLAIACDSSSSRLLNATENILVSLCSHDHILITLCALLEISGSRLENVEAGVTALLQEISSQKTEHVALVIDVLTALIKNLDIEYSWLFDTILPQIVSVMHQNEQLLGRCLICLTAIAWCNPVICREPLSGFHSAFSQAVQQCDRDTLLEYISASMNISELYPISMSDSSLSLFSSAMACVRMAIENQDSELFSMSTEAAAVLSATYPNTISDSLDELYTIIQDVYSGRSSFKVSTVVTASRDLICTYQTLGKDASQLFECLLSEAKTQKRSKTLGEIWQSIAYCLFKLGKLVADSYGPVISSTILQIVNEKPLTYCVSSKKRVIKRDIAVPLLRTVEQLILINHSSELIPIIRGLINLMKAKNLEYVPDILKTVSMYVYFTNTKGDILTSLWTTAAKEIPTLGGSPDLLGSLIFLTEIVPQKMVKFTATILEGISEIMSYTDIGSEIMCDAAVLYGSMIYNLNYRPPSSEIEQILKDIKVDKNEISLVFSSKFVSRYADSLPGSYIKSVSMAVLSSDDLIYDYIDSEIKSLLIGIGQNTSPEERGKIMKWREGDIEQVAKRLQ